jgi:transposase-like protein
MEYGMNLIDLLVYISDEEKAEEYLRNIKVLCNFEKCIYCSGSSLGYIRRGKVKCYGCKREWNRRKGSMVEKYRIEFAKFIIVIKLYSYGLSTAKIQKESKISCFSLKVLIKDIRNKIAFELNKLNYANDIALKANGIILYLDTERNMKYLSHNKKNIKLICNTAYFVINAGRRKNEHDEYYYKYEVKNENLEYGNINDLQRFWILNRKLLLLYTGRNRDELFKFLMERIYRYNKRNVDYIMKKL